MKRNNTFRWILLITLAAWSLVLITPPDEKLPLGLDLQGGYSFILEVDDSELSEEEQEDSQSRALEVIRNRVDQSGTKEPIIYPEPGTKRIVVQLPGLELEDREETLQVLKKQALLEFRVVHLENAQLVDEMFSAGLAPTGFEIVNNLPTGRPQGETLFRKVLDDDKTGFDNPEYVEMLRRFQRPSPTYEMFLERVNIGTETFYRPYFISKKVELTGEHIVQAFPNPDPFTGQQTVSLKFDGEGKEKFGNTTTEYGPNGVGNPNNPEGRQLAILLDGVVYSAPNINEPILGGVAQISGNFTLQEASLLSNILRAGALPAPIKVLEERVVSPTLGEQSVKSGIGAALWGGAAVLVFMLVYYLMAGVVVNLALIMDVILLPLGMILAAGFLGLVDSGGAHSSTYQLPTLTLPGIAGLVLTIGMAVDANVLIFERIREEQLSGKRFATAISSGYDKVFSTIFDANITTLIVAIILYWQGSGPIRGFAVTLSAGIIVSMYTSLVFTRMVFDIMAKKRTEPIKMMSLVKNSNIDFVSKRVFAAVFSTLIIVGSWVMFFQKGSENFGVDFTGGRALAYEYAETSDVDDTVVRGLLEAEGIGESYVQSQKLIGEDANVVEVKVGTDVGDQAREILDPFMETKGGKLLQDQMVGPQIGKEMQRKGIMAIVVALIGIVIYITFRFEFAFAMGAIAALAHDVLLTVGVFCLLGNQLSLPIVAALLTIVGYSVNDTIVVFDRIREDLALNKNKPYMKVANMSVNKTLSRTLLTSVTTLITVVMLLLFGGGAIHDFALALFIGILVGTYSSIFVATPVMLLWHKEDTETEKAKA